MSGLSQPCAIRAGERLASPLQRLFGLTAGYAGAAITLSLGLFRPRRPRSAAPPLFPSFCTTQFTDTRRPSAQREAVRVRKWFEIPSLPMILTPRAGLRTQRAPLARS